MRKFSRHLTIEIVGYVSACRKLGRGVGGSDATLVVAEDHVHDRCIPVLQGLLLIDEDLDMLAKLRLIAL